MLDHAQLIALPSPENRLRWAIGERVVAIRDGSTFARSGVTTFGRGGSGPSLYCSQLRLSVRITNPKRKRGSGLGTSLTLRASVSISAAGSYVSGIRVAKLAGLTANQ